MSRLRIGSLCSGYGGLELGVQAAIGGTTAWVSDVDKGACKILAHRFPGVPNIGDMTAVDWTQVEPVDVLTGGTPCQDLSHAGKRAGMTEGTRSNLWVAMREAIATLRPRLVVWENVAGAYSAEADSDLGSDPRLLDGTRRRAGEPVLRALGRVLGDLASLGYVGGWHGLRAADVGAPHGRLRVFVVAYPAGQRGAQGHPILIGGGAPGEWEATVLDGADRRLDALEHGDGGAAGNADVPRLEGRVARGRPDQRAARSDGVGTLLPSPRTTPDEWDAWTERMKAAHGNGNGHGPSLSIEAQRLLPTPMTVNRTSEKAKTGRDTSGPSRGGPSYGLEDVQEWGQYAAAIHRWEALTRQAPDPTERGPKGRPRLSPRLSEWMMGLPAGWVTDVPGITRNEALKAIGNGVVPQQAEAAVRFLLGVAERDA